MLESLRHRGPDDKGVWVDSEYPIALGHRRLSIIDLTENGKQPMTSHCCRYVLSLNGEIYNYLEIRNELEDMSYVFSGSSDTEVLLEAIACWGIQGALEKVIGMFAFALWDKQEKQMILARDRAGKKPLYYYKTGSLLYFASEIKAIRKLQKMNIDYNSVYKYLTFGFVPAPNTIYEKLYEVPAAHYLIVNNELGITKKSYWSLNWHKKSPISFNDAVEEIDCLLNDAVKIRLRADVPVGCFLSGGIDSGLLTAMASKHCHQQMKTFTVAFSDNTFDESTMALSVAEKYDTDHHVLHIAPDIISTLPKIIDSFDEPFADPSAIPTYCIAEEASRHLKVVLSGEGADELFGGYRRQQVINLYSKFRFFFELLPEKFWSSLSDRLPKPRGVRTRYGLLYRFLKGVGLPPLKNYMAWGIDGFHDHEKQKYLLHSFSGFNDTGLDFLHKRFNRISDLGNLDFFMAIDFLLGLHDDMLVKTDISTMAHGLEGRNPFLDHRIIEKAISLPEDSRMGNGKMTKPLLRTLAKRYLPTENVYAPKRGFEIPLIHWLKGDLKEMLEDVCLSKNGILSTLFKYDFLEKLLSEDQPYDPDRWSKRVWILFILSLWGEQNR